MEITDVDAVRHANAKEGRRTKLVETARELREKRDHLTRELASLENEIASMDIKDASNETRRVEEDSEEITCGHSCAHHAPLLKSALWSTLPRELLHLVFARLPLPEIIRLKCLSNEWKRNLTEKSEFRRACAEAHPKMFALVTEANDLGSYSIRFPDIKSNRWYGFESKAGDAGFDNMRASDGGLVCLVSKSKLNKKHPSVIVVCNPLTREWIALPSHSLSHVQPEMVQLVMNRDTQFYKVIVVAGKKRSGRGGGTGGGVEANIYDSETGVWSSTNVSPNLVFGYQYRWEADTDGVDEDFFQAFQLGPCVYDCVQGQFLKLEDPSSSFRGASVKGHDLLGDRLFVLHEEMHMAYANGQVWEFPQYCVSEYRASKREPNWKRLKVLRCHDFARPPRSFIMRLRVCNGFLLVIANNDEIGSYSQDIAWFMTCQRLSGTCFQLCQKSWILTPGWIQCVSFNGMPFLRADVILIDAQVIRDYKYFKNWGHYLRTYPVMV